MEYPAAMPTAFEEQIRKLGLNTKQKCIASKELRLWCEDNKERCYIPEWLLEEWGMSVDPNIPVQPRPRVAQDSLPRSESAARRLRALPLISCDAPGVA